MFDTVDNYKEEALNTILPIGKPYLDVEMSYMRDLTTTNIATQVPLPMWNYKAQQVSFMAGIS